MKRASDACQQSVSQGRALLHRKVVRTGLQEDGYLPAAGVRHQHHERDDIRACLNRSREAPCDRI